MSTSSTSINGDERSREGRYSDLDIALLCGLVFAFCEVALVLGIVKHSLGLGPFLVIQGVVCLLAFAG